MKPTFSFRSGRMLPVIVALSVVVPVAIVSIILIFSLLSHSFALQRDVRTTQSAAAELIRLQVDEETGIRGFQIHHDRRFLEPYYASGRVISAKFESLEFRMRGLNLPRSWWYVEDMRSSHDRWMRLEAKPILKGAADDLSRDIAAKSLVDHVRADGIELYRVLDLRAESSDSETVRRFTDVITLCVSLVGLTVFAVLLLARRQERLESDLARQSLAADAFQHAALPSELPSVPGMLFDSVYIPAISESRIGGDWYDAVRLPDGRVIISIGDVAGFGLHSSVTMAAVRQSIRAAAEMNPEPMMILYAADRTLRSQWPSMIVTSFVCVYDPVQEVISYASAGHPPPMLRHPDGSVVELDAVGLPLGLRVRDDSDYVRVVPFERGAFVVFYTDGLTESRRDVVAGMLELHALVENEIVALSDTPARAIYELMLPEGTADDVAIMTLRSDAVGDLGLRRWNLESEDSSVAAGVRHEFVAMLAARGICDEDLFSAELVFGEMIGNVVRYAPGSMEIVLDFNGSAPVLHFLDAGPGFAVNPRLPSDDMSERGRGLFLVWALTEEFTVSRLPSMGSHARAVLFARPKSRFGKRF